MAELERECMPASSSEDLTLPSFFIIGPPRTGTSWLHDVLSRYVSLPDPIKETRFFDLHFSRGLNWYLRYFDSSRTHQSRGEVAPTYFASPLAHERIAAAIPSAKVVCIFRHPVERVLSLYRLKRAYGMTHYSFEGAMQRDTELVESGKYATHLKKWQRTLGAGSIQVSLYEELSAQPQAYLDRLTDFIGMTRITASEANGRLAHTAEDLTEPRSLHCTRVAVLVAQLLKEQHLDRVVAGLRRTRLRNMFLGGGAPFGKISRAAMQSVLGTFLREIEELETILNYDLSAWKSVDTVLDKPQTAPREPPSPLPN